MRNVKAGDVVTYVVWEGEKVIGTRTFKVASSAGIDNATVMTDTDGLDHIIGDKDPSVIIIPGK